MCVSVQEYDYEYFKGTFNTVGPGRLGKGFAPTLQLMTLGASSKASSYFKESR